MIRGQKQPLRIVNKTFKLRLTFLLCTLLCTHMHTTLTTSSNSVSPTDMTNLSRGKLFAAAINLNDETYGRRLSDEWQYMSYSPWNDTRYIQDPADHTYYSMIYEAFVRNTPRMPKQLSHDVLFDIFIGHGVGPRTAIAQSHKLLHLFTKLPFLPLIPPPQRPSPEHISTEQRDILVQLATAINRHYYFGPASETDMKERQTFLTKRNITKNTRQGRTLLRLMTLGMVIIANNKPSYIQKLALQYAHMSKRRLLIYPWTKESLKETVYTVSLANKTTLSISNGFLTLLCMPQTLLLIENVHTLSVDETMLLSALFTGEHVSIKGKKLHIPAPPLVIGGTNTAHLTPQKTPYIAMPHEEYDMVIR